MLSDEQLQAPSTISGATIIGGLKFICSDLSVANGTLDFVQKKMRSNLHKPASENYTYIRTPASLIPH